MTDLTTVNTDTGRVPAKTTPKPTEPKTGGLAAPAPSAGKGKKKRPKPTPNAKRLTKASTVEAMLARKSGATLDQMCDVTGWQVHTCRAFMSGLRKKRRKIFRETGTAGKSVYRMAATSTAAKAS